MTPPATAEVDLEQLATQVGQATAEVGLPLHDCTGPDRAQDGVPAGLHPGAPFRGQLAVPAGVIVAWTVHDPLGRDGHRYRSYRQVLTVRNTTLGQVLGTLGFAVEPFGQAGAHLVTGHRDPPGGNPSGPFDT